MSKPAFTTWLLDQVGRQDAIGDLAINYDMDAQDAPRAITKAEVHQRMIELDAEPAYFVALEQAAEEYLRA